MNSINSSALRQTMQMQQSAPTSETKSTSETNKASGTTQTAGPSGMAQQDASDVSRMGSAGRLKVKEGKEKDKENLGKIRNSMSQEKTQKAETAESAGIAKFSKRKQSSIQEEDKKSAQQELMEYMKEALGDGTFSDVETLSILQNLKDNSALAKDAMLKEVIEDKITETIQNSLSTQMAISSAGVMPNDGVFTSGSEARDIQEKSVLGYSNQESFLSDLEQKFGTEKMNADFPAMLSHTMTQLSASMTALATSGSPEKGAVYAATSGISSLQQLTGVHVEASKMLTRMSEYYPTKERSNSV